MAKRFTDTSKWDKGKYSSLSLEMKLVWIYLCDKCDHAGVWDINMPLLSFQVGSNISLEDLLNGLGSWVEKHDDKLLLKDFVDFQYGKLNPDNRVHQSVLNRIEKLAPSKVLTSPFQGAKDKDKEKDKDLDKEKERENKKFDPDIDAIYKLYPRKEGKACGYKKLKVDLKTPELHAQCLLALNNFLEKHRKLGTEPQFIPHFKTWTSSWRDCLDDDYGDSDRLTTGSPAFGVDRNL